MADQISLFDEPKPQDGAQEPMVDSQAAGPQPPLNQPGFELEKLAGRKVVMVVNGSLAGWIVKVQHDRVLFASKLSGMTFWVDRSLILFVAPLQFGHAGLEFIFKIYPHLEKTVSKDS